MASPPPAHTQPASLSRSQSSRGDIRSLADAMLRSSLSRSASSSSAPVPAAATSTSPPPSYRKSPGAGPGVALGDPAPSVSPSHGISGGAEPSRPSREAPHMINRRPVVGSASSSASASLTRDQLRASKLKGEGENSSGHEKDMANLSPQVSAAEVKLRVQKLQQEVDWANNQTPQRATGGLFKTACSTDLLFLIDTTGSMERFIDAAKNQVRSITEDIKKTFLNDAEVRVAVVGYKDHKHRPHIQFLDFTPSADRVSQFLSELVAKGGDDIPEDVLGGVRQAINASWKQQTRCLIHIADAPAHGRALHDLAAEEDNYITPGSEPHRLTHEPLIRKLIDLNINYALLRIRSSTDRMAYAFSLLYTEAHADVKLLRDNAYYHKVALPGSWGSLREKAKSGANAELQFEELQLGTTYGALRHLVVKTAVSSASRTASRLTASMSRPSTRSSGMFGREKGAGSHLAAINEDEPGGSSGGRRSLLSRFSRSGTGSTPVTAVRTTARSAAGTLAESVAEPVVLETVPPLWDTPGWLDETLVVEGFCPDVVVHGASTLNEMMAHDDNIKLSVTELTIFARSKPFAQGSLRTASYARTAASTNRFVVKSFTEGGKGLAHLAEDMRCQALCKAFALEFNSLLGMQHQLDFIVTTSLQGKPGMAAGEECISLEPYIDGEYVKYNSNAGFVKEEEPGDRFNGIAQAFSHFTFERSWGSFLVTDLQGVGRLLTDPGIQTSDPERFKLSETNLNDEGFKFFFATHVCNSVCKTLELKSNREMVISGNFNFRERWPTMDSTVCCSNKLCRKIIHLASADKSDDFPGFQWCSVCWPQLRSSMTQWICVAPGPNHEFNVSKFFYESQGRGAPRKCSDHRERDTTVSSSSVVGGSLWNRMKSANQKASISGRSW